MSVLVVVLFFIIIILGGRILVEAFFFFFLLLSMLLSPLPVLDTDSYLSRVGSLVHGTTFGRDTLPNERQ